MINNSIPIINFAIVGESAVGKSCILLQFIDKRFRQEYKVTIGVDFGSRIIEVDTQKLKIHIWDSAGQERYRSLPQSYYRNAYGVLLVYDITDRDSFNQVEKWIEDIRTKEIGRAHV